MSKTRNHRSPEEKASLLRRHHNRQGAGHDDLRGGRAAAERLLPLAAGAVRAGSHVLGNGSTGRPSSREQELEKKVSALEARLTKKDEVIAEISQEYVSLKKRAWGALSGRWVPPDTRDAMVDFVRELSERTEITQERIVGWVGISRGKFFDRRRRYGKVNEHNGLVPRDHWLEAEEEHKIVAFHDLHPLEGYRRLTYMMIDENVVAASPSTVYRVLERAGRISRWDRKPRRRAPASFSLSRRTSTGTSTSRT